jgi:tetrapyrrole methylase family protein/MazG family protein
VTQSLDRIFELIDLLRGENGCPWDRKQTSESMGRYLVEETFELLDAIQSGSSRRIREELGDVLFQVLFIARLERDSGHFRLEEVVDAVWEKMTRRHPHVFGGETAVDPTRIRRRWHQIKKAEKVAGEEGSVLDSVPENLPALMRAYRVSERAAGAGFDWDDLQGVLLKTEEEWAEFKREIHTSGKDDAAGRTATEFGDILFTLVNVARFAGIHPETALGRSIQKFQRRFRHMEYAARTRGKDLEALDRDSVEALWEEAKLEIA